MDHDREVRGEPHEITGRAEVIDESGQRKRYLEVRAELSSEDRESLSSLRARLEEVLGILVKHRGDDHAIIIHELSANGGAQSALPKPVHKGPQGDLGNREYLICLVRETVGVLRRDGFRITHETVTTRIGIPTRSLKRACAWHGLAWWPWPPDWI